MDCVAEDHINARAIYLHCYGVLLMWILPLLLSAVSTLCAAHYYLNIGLDLLINWKRYVITEMPIKNVSLSMRMYNVCATRNKKPYSHTTFSIIHPF